MATDDEQKKALWMIKAVYEDGEAEINGRVYKFLGTTHAKRKKVFAFFSSIQGEITSGNFSFIDAPAFKGVEDTINSIVAFDDSLISKLENHWEKYPEDYMKFISVSMGVISYPFLKGSLTA